MSRSEYKFQGNEIKMHIKSFHIHHSMYKHIKYKEYTFTTRCINI